MARPPNVPELEGPSTDWPDAWLSRDPLPDDPMPLLSQWLDEAFAAGSPPNPHAFALATVAPDGSPDVRFVLCNAIECDRGSLVFYTSRESRKGEALRAMPRAAAAFHFVAAGRQARVRGAVSLTSDAESDAYFATRPVDSQIGAWASTQSAPLASRSALVAEIERQAAGFGVDLEKPGPADVPRPASWGGYRLTADAVELWHSRPGRAHDRAEWLRGADGRWRTQRLQP